MLQGKVFRQTMLCYCPLYKTNKQKEQVNKYTMLSVAGKRGRKVFKKKKKIKNNFFKNYVHPKEQPHSLNVLENLRTEHD